MSIGFYAEYVAVNADAAARVPNALDPLHSGAVVTTVSRRFKGSTTHCGCAAVTRY
jgi:NADPH:quinone reductase-like Zn-dependent oxidoreductase